MNNDENKTMVSEQKKQVLDPGIDKIATDIKKQEKKYFITLAQAKNEKGFVQEDKGSWSYSVKILLDNGNTEVELIYYDFCRTLAPAQSVVDDKKGNKKWFSYSESGGVSTYLGTKNEQLGLALSFFDDGTLAGFVECKDGKYFGREMMWDESGKLISSKINDGKKVYKVGE
jgi:antitoxin component YwqK of YwqJK toxin-antitoxin module